MATHDAIDYGGVNSSQEIPHSHSTAGPLNPTSEKDSTLLPHSSHIAVSINSQERVIDPQNGHDYDGSDSINSRIDVATANGDRRKSKGRIRYTQRREADLYVLLFIILTFIVACTHLLLSFLRLINSALSGIDNSLDGIIIYQFCMPVLSLLPLLWLILYEDDSNVLRRMKRLPRFTRRVPGIHSVLSKVPTWVLPIAISVLFAVMVLIGTALEQTKLDWSTICANTKHRLEVCQEFYRGSVKGVSRAATACSYVLLFFWLILLVIYSFRGWRIRQGKLPVGKRISAERADFPCPSCTQMVHYDFLEGKCIVVDEDDQV